jgi:hypothetical protein
MRKQAMIVAVLCALLMLTLAGCGLGSAELSSLDRSTAPPTQVVVATPEATSEATPVITQETQPPADEIEGAEKALDAWEVDKVEEDQGVASDAQQEDVIGGPLS